ESGEGLDASEPDHEPAEKVPVLLCPGDSPAWRVADDVVGDVGHGIVEILAGPGLVVGQRCAERWRGAGIGHGNLPCGRGSGVACPCRPPLTGGPPAWGI